MVVDLSAASPAELGCLLMSVGYKSVEGDHELIAGDVLNESCDPRSERLGHRMIMLRYVRIFLLFAICFWTATDTKALSHKPPMSDADVLNMFKNKNPISGRTISGQAILDALLWAQHEASAGRVDQLGPFRIWDSIINGRVDLEQLQTTPVDRLPERLRQHFEGRESVFVPVSIVIQGTVFKFNSGSGGRIVSFEKVVFEEGVKIEECVFEGVAHFRGSVFQKHVSFSGTSFDRLAEFESVQFLGRVEFNSAKFKEEARFVRATFNGTSRFDDALFHLRADFAGASFLDKEAHFPRVTFDDVVSFNQANVEGEISFDESDFPSAVYFNDINRSPASRGKGVLVFKGLSFHGRAYFSDTHLEALWFSLVPRGGVHRKDAFSQLLSEAKRIEWNPFTPVRFEKYATFRGLGCVNAGFTDVEFMDFVDFGDAKFENSVCFDGSTIGKEANFYKAEFPVVPAPSTQDSASSNSEAIPKGLQLDNIRFQKPVNFEWEQLNGRLNTTDKATWELLENTFKQNGDLEGQNESMYQRRILERKGSQGWNHRVNWFEFSFWGYGVRPLRLGLWIVLFYLLFTALYWTQTKPLAIDKSRRGVLWRRIAFAVDFGSRTSWKLGYGYQNSRTRLFKVLTVIHSIGFKLLVLCLFKAFSNTSPLLNELIGKLVRL